MSSLTHRLVTSAPMARSIAIALLLGTTMLASPLTVARADGPSPTPTQLPQTSPPQAGVETPDSSAETVEQRISHLHAALKITSEQQVKWERVAQAMRENAAEMQKLVAERTTTPPQTLTAVQDLKSYEKFTQAHADGLKNLIASFEGLYTSMTDEQKKNADEVFQTFGHGPAASHG